MNRIKRRILATIATVVLPGMMFAQKPVVLTVQANKPIADVQPTMYGVFFEDINFAADGGIYAELVKNRSFEFYDPQMGWNEVKKDGAKGALLVINQEEVTPNNPRYMRVKKTTDNGSFGIVNEGFRGIGVNKDAEYRFSVFARNVEGAALKIKVQLLNADNTVIGETEVSGLTTEWNKYKATFKSSETVPNAKLSVTVEGKGTLDMDMVSLFPVDTWRGRENGMRKDLVQLLADMKPGFVRFPGGCIVEGHDLAVRYQWKKTVGNVEDRKVIVNRWNTEFKHRPTPDYYQSFGLGFYEYFLLSEDLGAQPLPILNCGMACQFNIGEVVPLDKLDPYIQDALDLVEFANGDVSTKWGALRSQMGHPKPFNLKYLGIGNEQWGEQYVERYKAFAQVLSAKHPEIVLVSGSGPNPDGKEFDYLWGEINKMDDNLKPALVDEHYYRTADWFLKHADRYDSYDRSGPKVFAGEYAGQSDKVVSAKNRNNWKVAIAEAAYLTGMERNADVISMTSYAPLFAHVDAWQWTPDMIWFDNLRSMGTPNYYVQKLFSTNAGTNVLSILNGKNKVIGQDGLYASTVFDKNSNEIIIKLVNVNSTPLEVVVALKGKSAVGEAKWLVMSSDDEASENSLDKPMALSPVEKTLSVTGKTLKLTLGSKSLNVFRVPVK